MFKISFWPKNSSDWLFVVIVLASLSALVLSLVSWLRLCSESCSEVHNWRLFGLPFEYFGAIFFVPLLLMLGFSKKHPALFTLCGFLLAGAAGSELKFILLQKYQIGTWCPVCLSIAACIFIALGAFITKEIIELRNPPKDARGETMNARLKGFTGLSTFALGFLIATLCCVRFDPLEAAANTIKNGVAFGLEETPMEVYVFTDWACPACRQLEPDLEKIFPETAKKARVTFVDVPLHKETLNYSPYNVSFMIKNKPQYFKLRSALTTLAAKTATPTDEQVEKLATKVGVKYQQLNFSDISLSQNYFQHLAKQFEVTQTPTVVVVNTQAKKGKRLIGLQEITASNLDKAIESLAKQKDKGDDK